jgi:ParB family transcriptional regulator, chromosome partitioning protein
MGTLMGRKDLLRNLMPGAGMGTARDGVTPVTPGDGQADPGGAAAGQARPPQELTAVTGGRPRAARGAIGVVGQSIAELRSRALLELDPWTIDADGPEDRLELDPDEDAALAASIRAHGQQVPILVRPHPETPDRYRIVYGRRRVLAARDLGLPVRALVRDLDDRAAVMAQGQENTQRRGLSFIEKAHLARQMRDAGYDRAAIADAVNADRTIISRMLAVVDRLPVEVVRQVGAAPSVGRDRWTALAELYAASGWDAAAAVALAVCATGPDTSDRRFEALYHALTLPRRRSTEARRSRAPGILRDAEGRPIGRVRSGARTVTLRLDAAAGEGFGDWLAERIGMLHRDWRSEIDG